MYFMGESDCYLDVGWYMEGGHICLTCWSRKKGPMARLTVNLPVLRKFRNKYVVFLDTNNVPEAPDLVKGLGIGTEIGTKAVSGYCEYPLYVMHPRELYKYTAGAVR